MKVGFVETMRGTLKANDGSESKVEFEVHAHAEHLRKFLKDGQTQLKGIMRAAPYAAEAPAMGELTIDLPRSLTYLVTFEANNVKYRLEGKKTPSLLSPIRSMTVMGKDPRSSVIDSNHETHDVHNLFICDGSAMPGSLGVNPQLTIMAMSLRAADAVDRRLAAS